MSSPKHIVLATDHAGFALKEAVKAHLKARGYDITDVGTFSEESVDYPAIIREGCEKVVAEKIPGIVFGGSGIGESIVANKIHGIRAARCTTVEDARLARAHNDANVLSLGGRIVAVPLALEMVDMFLDTEFEGGRHARRVADIEPPLL